MIELQKALLYTHFTESRAYKTHLTYKDSHTIKVRAQKNTIHSSNELIKNLHMISPSILLKGLLLATLSSYCLSAFTQETDFTDCRSITDRQARYACYDRIEASEDSGVVELDRPAPRANPDNLPVVSLPSRNREVASDTPATESQQVTDQEAGQEEIDDFGRSTDTANSRQSTRIVEDDEGQKELIDTIASIRQLGQGMSVITLSSGQKWQQMITKRYFLKEGEEVRIYPTIWGNSYRLTSKRLGGFIQVKRVN